MTRTNLEILMKTKKITITKISRNLDVTPQSIYHCISGRMPSTRIERALEEAFELPIDIIRKAWNDHGKPVMTPEIKAAMDSFKLAVNA